MGDQPFWPVREYSVAVKYNPQSGFSLTEIAIVLVVGGILLMLVTTGVVAMMAGIKLEKSKKNLEIVSQAIQVYAERNNRLPCAASRQTDYLDANYGREVTCSGPRAGTVVVPGSAGGTVRIGFLPTRDLGISDELGYDAWGSRLIYVVSEEQTDANTFDLENGRIRIDDSNGIEVTTGSNATYAVFSVGPDRRGGYNSAGNLMVACNDGVAVRVDSGNCNDADGRFVTTVAMADTGTARHYDDLLLYESDFAMNIIPPGALLAFDRDKCPTGWTAHAAAAGRVIVGLTGGSKPATDITPPPWETNGTDQSITFSSGIDNAGGWFSRFSDQDSPERVLNLPPYASYLYCRKNGTAP